MIEAAQKLARQNARHAFPTRWFRGPRGLPPTLDLSMWQILSLDYWE
jgi:hypothetical protein